MNSPIASSRSLSGEGWAAIAGAVSVGFLLAKKLLGPKPAKPEPVSRAEFCAEMLASRERMHTDHLAMLEKLDANHRELLAPWSGRPLASTRSKPASPAWTSARGTNHANRLVHRVRTRSTASLLVKIGTWWNASLRARLTDARTLLARATWPALPATRASSQQQNKQTKKVSNV